MSAYENDNLTASDSSSLIREELLLFINEPHSYTELRDLIIGNEQIHPSWRRIAARLNAQFEDEKNNLINETIQNKLDAQKTQDQLESERDMHREIDDSRVQLEQSTLRESNINALDKVIKSIEAVDKKNKEKIESINQKSIELNANLIKLLSLADQEHHPQDHRADQWLNLTSLMGSNSLHERSARQNELHRKIHETKTNIHQLKIELSLMKTERNRLVLQKNELLTSIKTIDRILNITLTNRASERLLRRNARVSRQQNTNINNQLSIENQAALREELSSKNNAIDKRHLEKWREARSLIYPIFIEVLEKQRMQMLDSESKALIQLIKTSRDYLIVIELIKHIVKNLNVSTQALQKTNNMILHKDNTQAVFWKELAFVLLSALILTITVSILTMMCFTQIACWSTILSMCLLLSLEMSLDARASDACISQIQENIQEKIAVELEQVVNAEANEIQFDTVVEEYLSTILVPKMSISTTEKILEQLFSKARILMKKMESIQPEINESQTTLSHSPFSFFPLSNSDKPQNHSLVMSLAPH